MSALFYLGMALICVIGIAALFSKQLIPKVGKTLVFMDMSRQLSKSKLVEKKVTLSNGIVAWYLERASQGSPDGPTLVILPGSTVYMRLMGVEASALLASMPKRRVIILELPYHGKNAAFDYEFSNPDCSMSGMANYVEEFRKALALEEPFDLMGYSLGGGIATHYVLAHHNRVNKLLLLAPYYYEAATDIYNAIYDQKQWGNLNGWETSEDMAHWFHTWLGLDTKDTFPGLIMSGLAAVRSELYPPEYWSKIYDVFFEAWDESKSFLEDNASSLAELTCSVLVLTAAMDKICDPTKLTRLDGLFNSELCTVKSLNSGHFFASGGQTLSEVAAPDMVEFFSA